MTGQKLYNGAIEIAREEIEQPASSATLILAMKEKPGTPQGVEYIVWRAIKTSSGREMYEWGSYHFDIFTATERFKERIEELKRL